MHPFQGVTNSPGEKYRGLIGSDPLQIVQHIMGTDRLENLTHTRQKSTSKLFISFWQFLGITMVSTSSIDCIS